MSTHSASQSAALAELATNDHGNLRTCRFVVDANLSFAQKLIIHCCAYKRRKYFARAAITCGGRKRCRRKKRGEPKKTWRKIILPTSACCHAVLSGLANNLHELHAAAFRRVQFSSFVELCVCIKYPLPKSKPANFAVETRRLTAGVFIRFSVSTLR